MRPIGLQSARMGIADTSIAVVAALFSGGAAVAAWRALREANATPPTWRRSNAIAGTVS